MSEPQGYLKQQLYERRNLVRAGRFQTYAQMLADTVRSSGTPIFYVVEVDETNSNAEDVLYWWDGIELSPVGAGSAPVAGTVTLANVTGLDPILRMLGMGSGVSKAVARTYTSANPTVFMINDLSGDNLAVYDPNDTASADNDSTVIVGANNRRYKIMNVLKALQLISNTTDIFQ